ncbi:MAG: hypothetical protein KC609_21810, partial [Myxococcales bacterium]|nr:hypothetical protein [Myxococcales bacterium]
LVARDEAPDMEEIVARTVAQSDELNQRLVMVRIFHELCRLELEDYAFYVERVLMVGGDTEPLEYLPVEGPS